MHAREQTSFWRENVRAVVINVAGSYGYAKPLVVSDLYSGTHYTQEPTSCPDPILWHPYLASILEWVLEETVCSHYCKGYALLGHRALAASVNPT